MPRALPVGIYCSGATLVLAAARAAEEGQSLSQIRAATEKLIARMNVISMLNTLKYLQKGGRIGAATALVGTLLSIKPVLTLKDGEAKVLTKARTRGRAIEYMLKFMEERMEGSTSVHARALEQALALEKEVRARFDCAELHLIELGPVFGTHTGPGTLGLAFYSEED